MIMALRLAKWQQFICKVCKDSSGYTQALFNLHPECVLPVSHTVSLSVTFLCFGEPGVSKNKVM